MIFVSYLYSLGHSLFVGKGCCGATFSPDVNYCLTYYYCFVSTSACTILLLIGGSAAAAAAARRLVSVAMIGGRMAAELSLLSVSTSSSWNFRFDN